MNHGSLFSGIGGFDLSADWIGWNNIFQVENDPFCLKVLQKNFSNAKRFTDIRTFDGREYAGTIDIVSGGFPCQPYSLAGKRGGQNDDRALWGEMFRVIREIQPAWVVCENVVGLISLGLDAVLSDLESIGYACQAFVIPACSVGAIHRRDRIWILAYANGPRWEQLKFTTEPSKPGYDSCIDESSFDDALRLGWEKRGYGPKPGKKQIQNDQFGNSNRGSDWPTMWQPNDQADFLRTAYGVSRRLDQRNQRIKALGNAIVPHVAFEIFKAIDFYEKK